MVSDGKCGARARVQHLESKLLANGNQAVRSQRSIDVHRCRHIAQAVFRQDNDLHVSRLVEADEIAAQLVDLTDIRRRGRIAGSDALQVVVEVREVDER